ncbi:MAG: nuclear transport factor 2 family protein [Pseudomonadales bacterium]|jgi:hypothetical protein|nr:nuclear transport factor 2 family protein [Pseudomonadales bacterium]
MQSRVKSLFERYERAFNQALAGQEDMDEIAAFYTNEFIAASPAGVMGGKNDAQLRQVMTQGYAYYRQIGTRAMRVREIRIAPIDEQHCIAHVGWRAIYRKAQEAAEIVIEFEVHYLVQLLNGTAKIFGWIAGDEQALLRERGII